MVFSAYIKAKKPIASQVAMSEQWASNEENTNG